MTYRDRAMEWISGDFFTRAPFANVFPLIMMRDEVTPTTYGITDITGLQAALDGKANAIHTHAISDITGLAVSLSGKANAIHTHIIADVTGLSTALSNKSDVGHTHTIANITGLQAALDAKGTSNFSGVYNDLTGKPTIPAAQIQSDWAQTNTSALDYIKNKPERSYTNPARSLNTAFQVSTTQDMYVSYSVLVTSVAALLVGSRGRVTLQYADNAAMTTNLVDIMSVDAGVGSGLVVTNYLPVVLSGIIPRGKYARLVSTNIIGSPTYAVQSTQEVSI